MDIFECCIRLTAEGRGAATVYRDRTTGKLVSKDVFVDSRKDVKAKAKEEKVT
jgi:hypothetical protein